MDKSSETSLHLTAKYSSPNVSARLAIEEIVEDDRYRCGHKS